MILALSSEEKPIKYKFDFQKNSIYKEKTISVINTSGLFSVFRKDSLKFNDSIDYEFKSLKFIQKGVKDPLVYDMVSWTFNLKLNITGVSSKEYMKTIWKKYRDKYRTKENLALFTTLESLNFKVPFGMEYNFLSNGPYFVFFINFFNQEIKLGDIIRGIDVLLTPLSIPINSFYKCVEINDKHILFEGSVILDDDRLEEMIIQKTFIDQAKSYHFSKDFRIESDIKVCIDIKTGALHSASFKMDINGEDGTLKEEIFYEIKSNLNVNLDQSYIASPLVEIDGKKKKWWK